LTSTWRFSNIPHNSKSTTYQLMTECYVHQTRLYIYNKYGLV